ncbi:MAG: phage tail tube protein [Thermodesulfobacteriota bacterium]|nr:MAG: phage tail tube protein [Thermodesulfobacteriota bacterium]
MLQKSKAVVLVKLEAGGYGVDPVPTAAANAILCSAPEVESLGRRIERANVKPHYGAQTGFNIGEGVKVSFTTELKGSGALGVAPEIGPLLRACNFTETVTPDTQVDYDPNSDASTGESVTIYFYRHNILHKVSGCRGTFGVELKAGEYGNVKFDFTGLWQGPVDQNIPADPVFNETDPARVLSAAFAIDGYAAVIENFKFDAGNEIARRNSANAATGILEYFIKGRSIKGECDPEAVALATKNFWSMWETSAQVALSATVGSAAGNKCVITAPKVQLDVPKYGDRENILTYALPIIFTPDAGNDEISLSFQ